MARVFVSYASADRECAGQLHEWLVAEGHEVFLDQDPGKGIAVGEEWDKRLHERLRWADAVVCVATSAAVASTWCTAEVSIALSRGNRLLPVRAEPDVDHPLLPSAHYADLTVDSAAARTALVEALRRVDAAGGFGWPDDKSPFPGLRPLDVDEHRVFFGRVVRCSSWPGWCGPPPSGPSSRCCWWWAPRGAASRRWWGPDCCM